MSCLETYWKEGVCVYETNVEYAFYIDKVGQLFKYLLKDKQV